MAVPYFDVARGPALQCASSEVLRELLGFPDELEPLCVIVVGHKGMERKPFNEDHLQWEKVHANKW